MKNNENHIKDVSANYNVNRDHVVSPANTSNNLIVHDAAVSELAESGNANKTIPTLREKIKSRLKNDGGHEEDKYIIRERNSEYIVYIDKHNNLRWEVGEHTMYHTDQDKLEILGSIEYLSAFPTEYLNDKQLFSWARMIAHAISLITYNKTNKSGDNSGNNNNVIGAKKILEHAEIFIRTRTKEKARIWMIESSVIASGSLFLLLFMLSAFVNHDPSWKWMSSSFFNSSAHDVLLLLLSMGSGIVGAQFSVLTRLYKIKVDPAAGRMVHWGEATIRVMTGVFSAIIVFILLKSGIILNFLNLGDNGINHGREVWILAFLSMLAGFSERFIPSFLDKIEEKRVNNVDEVHEK
ncbi:MAG: hypothetical protein L3K52_02375 [Candidatus Thiothrix sulfatifontis]|nr:MAG: hypothetical protein L3K52_02375 [Candidatus Thiothrix sulfatifontis]